ncbi:aliphatic sulfonate ABC transporter substrate-binding protein [Oculatella sp. LEGE 06141]|uniref:aliphatic sulfonate ABC transporter substrate-binding protein n=1 Tax=Oculatella sp. LEGE 06141 TaxID=1828648 RepID=UPI00187DE624|nr:aliphatic sulfonate ABC transporter substrate-binding protein [Oculatella sp. LEGE 06141]MBE9178860.1 aliphatic sulfonate ABC transporter substrate-binding protein [Oculatella sp. LEGE 06141]
MSYFPSHHRWTRRQALWFMAGAVGTAGLHACSKLPQSSSATNSTNLTPATIAVTSWIGNTALYIAEEKNFFRDEGLNLTVRTFGTVAESFPAFSVGQLQAVAPVTSEVVALAAQGTDYRIVAVMDTSSGADAILAQGSISSIEDFKGKRIAVQRGGVGHFFLLQILAEVGMREQDVTIVDTTPEAGAAAFEAGNVEIAYSYPPYIDSALAVQKNGRIIYDSSKMPTAIADVYAFSTDFIQTHPEAVQGFVRSIFSALDFLQSNEGEALAIAAKRLEMTPQDLATQLEGVNLPDLATNQEMLGNPESDLYLLKPLTALAEFLQDQNQIETLPDLSNLIDPQFVMALN